MNLYSITLNDVYQRHQLQEAENRRMKQLADHAQGRFGTIKRIISRNWQKSVKP